MLHRLVYLSAVAGVVHYYWLVKSDVRWPLAYASAVGVLLLFRIPMIRGLLGKLDGVRIKRPIRTPAGS
jgi:sulfoxide reductase heme-binding subunit YedZ